MTSPMLTPTDEAALWKLVWTACAGNPNALNDITRLRKSIDAERAGHRACEANMDAEIESPRHLKERTMIDKLLANPALIVGLVRALLIFAATFGLALTQAQQDATLELVGSVLTVASLVLTAVTLTVTTPKATPTLDQGTVVKVITPDGVANKTQVVA